MDDVTFSRNGRDAETWRLHRVATAMSGVAVPGRSLVSMNACRRFVYLLSEMVNRNEYRRFVANTLWFLLTTGIKTKGELDNDITVNELNMPTL